MPAQLLWISSALFFAVSFLHPLSAIFIIPAFFLYLKALERTKSLKHILLYSLLLGTIKAAGVLSWIWYIYPLQWLTQQPEVLQILMIGLYWITAALSIAVGTVASSVLIYVIIKKYPWGLFLLPPIWLLGELMGSFSFSLLTLGPGSVLGIQFSYGYVGYVLANVPLLQSVAQFGGVYALTLLLTTISVLIYKWHKAYTTALKEKTILLSSTLGLIILVLLSSIYQQTQLPFVQNKTVITMETRIDKKFMAEENGFKEKKQEAKQAVLSALTFNPDAIILPEDARFSQLFTVPRQVLGFMKENGGQNTILLDSGRTKNVYGQVVLKNYIFNTEDDTLYTMDKNYLTPHGEYMPYLHNAILKKFIDEKTKKKLATDLAYTMGEQNDYSTVPNDTPTILSCMESTWPSASTKRTKNRNTPFIAHTISHSWFNTPYILWYQQDRMLQTQAIWSNTPIISSSNMAPHSVYRANGKIEKGKLLKETQFWDLYEVAI